MKNCIVTGKAIFKTETIAKKLADKFSKTLEFTLGVYRCKFCRGWHFTHKKQ